MFDISMHTSFALRMRILHLSGFHNSVKNDDQLRLRLLSVPSFDHGLALIAISSPPVNPRRVTTHNYGSRSKIRVGTIRFTVLGKTPDGHH